MRGGGLDVGENSFARADAGWQLSQMHGVGVIPKG